jgi:hypothetical protein
MASHVTVTDLTRNKELLLSVLPLFKTTAIRTNSAILGADSRSKNLYDKFVHQIRVLRIMLEYLASDEKSQAQANFGSPFANILNLLEELVEIPNPPSATTNVSPVSHYLTAYRGRIAINRNFLHS